MKKRIAIFASGSGTNAENIIRFFEHDSRFQVVLILSDRSDAYVLTRARNHDIPCRHILREVWKTGEEVAVVLSEYNVDFIVLAGFLRRVPDLLLQRYPCRIINIHPSLLPKYGGKGMYGNHVHEAVVAAGERQTGITVHYVNEQYDEGAIIFQATCAVTPDDTPESVAEKVHGLEYSHFPKVIEQVLLKEFPVFGSTER